jgi:Ser/Thr protein kinase RdoA (MazF antagonist)
MQIAAKSIKAPKLLFPLHAGQIPHIFNHVYMTTVTEFIPGQVLNRSIAVVPSELIRITERVGCVIRKMTKKFGMTKLRGRKKRLIWNFANFDSVVIELGACLESDLRKDFAALVPATSTALNEAFRDTSQFQLCHYDCNDDNIIVTDNDEIGIIDFGDVDLGPRVVDVSLACCYILINVFSTSEEVDPFYVKSVVESAMNGFTLTVPITDKERALIPVLIVARCIMSICIQSSQRCANPDNSEYLSVSFKGSRALLRFVNSVSLDKFISLFSSL